MEQTYNLIGMTCGSCEAKVNAALLSLENVTKVFASKETNSATITMNKQIALLELQQTLPDKYQISIRNESAINEENKTWVATYKPILLIFGYILGITASIQLTNPHFDFMQMMSQFMAGFFITFSFFKMLNLVAFAASYSMYDVVAKKMKLWGFIYPFVELGLGISFLITFQPFATNLTTFVVMSISSIGVIQSVIHKKKIQCACLGAVFNLPMSSVTIIEDLLMLLMSGIMLLSI